MSNGISKTTRAAQEIADAISTENIKVDSRLVAGWKRAATVRE